MNCNSFAGYFAGQVLSLRFVFKCLSDPKRESSVRHQDERYHVYDNIILRNNHLWLYHLMTETSQCKSKENFWRAVHQTSSHHASIQRRAESESLTWRAVYLTSSYYASIKGALKSHFMTETSQCKSKENFWRAVYQTLSHHTPIQRRAEKPLHGRDQPV